MPDTYAYPVTPETQGRMARCAAGECASKIVAAYIGALPEKENYPLSQALNDTLMLADTLSTWFINGNQTVEDPEDPPF